MQTQASTASNTIVYARNPAFGYVFLADKPVQLTFTAGYLTSENKNTYPKEQNVGYFEVTSFGDFGVTTLTAPFTVKVKLSNSLFTIMPSSCKQILPTVAEGVAKPVALSVECSALAADEGSGF